ncbi:MAG: hypothetical protein M0C28_07985 [Candidatus Moduliflexus flocculans]|nr:hypothetical protein [Candidatus Moduliflexus flocculans]
MDWVRTEAYALGLGGVYLNQKGREAQGVVAPGPRGQSPARELQAKLTGLKDAETGRDRRSTRVYDTDEIYAGPYKDNSPDLIIGYNARLPGLLGVGHRNVTGARLRRQHQVLERRPLRRPSSHRTPPAMATRHRRGRRPRRAVLQPQAGRSPRRPRSWTSPRPSWSSSARTGPAHMDGRSLLAQGAGRRGE